MKKYIKENKNVSIILIICILILGFLFYWFQLRPVQIKKECFNKHLSTQPDLTYEHFLEEKNNPVKEIEIPFGEKAYNRCLLEHGL